MAKSLRGVLQKAKYDKHIPKCLPLQSNLKDNTICGLCGSHHLFTGSDLQAMGTNHLSLHAFNNDVRCMRWGWLRVRDLVPKESLEFRAGRGGGRLSKESISC